MDTYCIVTVLNEDSRALLIRKFHHEISIRQFINEEVPVEAKIIRVEQFCVVNKHNYIYKEGWSSRDDIYSVFKYILERNDTDGWVTI